MVLLILHPLMRIGKSTALEIWIYVPLSICLTSHLSTTALTLLFFCLFFVPAAFLACSAFSPYSSSEKIGAPNISTAYLFNDECYLRLIDEVIVNEDNSITIIDNAGHRVSKENISKNIKKINGLEEKSYMVITLLL